MTQTLYTIRDWHQHFEHAKKADVGRYTWVAIPNKHDGLSFRKLMRMDRGVELFGAWILIVQVASKCPTRGVLADSTGPLSPEDLALKTDCPSDVMSLALSALCQLGWITEAPYESDNHLPESCPPPDNHVAATTQPRGPLHNSTEQDKTVPDISREAGPPDETLDQVKQVFRIPSLAACSPKNRDAIFRLAEYDLAEGELKRAHGRYRKTWPNMSCTLPAIVDHWPLFRDGGDHDTTPKSGAIDPSTVEINRP